MHACNMHTHAKANLLHVYLCSCMHAHMHALQPQLNYRAIGRRASRHQERGAQRPRATLNYNCAINTAGPTRRERHRRARGGIERDARGTGGTKGD